MAKGSVAVVGAGLAGLSAALELADAGFDVEVFERSRLLGGKATSFTVGDAEIDNGQHVYLGCCSEFLDFVGRVGMSSELYLQERFEVLMLRRGDRPSLLRARSWPAPYHLLPALLGYRYLGWPAKLQVARGIAEARRRNGAKGSFADWLRRHGQGEEARRAFWEPFLVPALNAPLEDVSADSALFVISTAFAESPRSACIGFSRVPLARIAEEAARRAGGVHLRSAVTGPLVEDGAVRGVCLSDGRKVRADFVVLAVPPRTLARLLGDPARFGLGRLEEFRSEPIVDVHLWYDRAELGVDFVALLDSPVQWVFQKAPGYLCCSLSAAGELVSRPEGELVELCERELSAALPSLSRARLRRGVATRDPEATFVPAPGLRRPGPRTRDPALFIAGAWTDTGWPATMESAVRSGRTAARAIVSRTEVS